MNKLITVFIAFLCLAPFCPAQERDVCPAAMEMDRNRAIWFGSENSAGMILTPLTSYESVGASYDIEQGNWRRYSDGDLKTLNVSAEGASKLGKGRVWGRFDYNNITAEDTKYNTIFLNMDDDMPFYVADDILSFWKKQRYDLGMKAATPLYKGRYAFGVEASYFSESGAKQIDPRGYGYEYGLTVSPSALFVFGSHAVGLALDYEAGNMRMSNINNALTGSHAVYVMHGLGNYEDYIVSLLSSSSLGLVFDNKKQYGASLQYSWTGDGTKLLAEVYGKMRNWDISQTPSKPKKIGTASRTMAGGSVMLTLDRGSFFSKASVSGEYRSTNGIEYLQKLNKDYSVQAWETVGKNVKSKYRNMAASLAYDIYRKRGAGYSWTAGASACWNDRNERYLLPVSEFMVGNVEGEVHGKKNFIIGGSSLLAGLSAAYTRNLSSAYSYQGAGAESCIVTDLYPNTLAYMSADRIRVGANVNWAFSISSKAMMSVKADCSYVKTNDELLDKRMVSKFAIEFIF